MLFKHVSDLDKSYDAESLVYQDKRL